jgi:hypothetical protein
MARQGGVRVNRSIASEVAAQFNPLRSGRVLAYGSLAVLVALAVGIAGGWWTGASLEEGSQAKRDFKTEQAKVEQARADLKTANDLLVRQQSVIATSSRQLEDAAKRFATISQEAARERQENQHQMALIRGQLEAALAARPDLAGVRVGPGVLDAWNAANRGRASGNTGAAQPAPAVRPGADAAGTQKPAGGR